MESIVSYFADLGINFMALIRFSGMILVGALLLSLICRFIFQKQTIFGQAISSSIAIIFIYVLTVLIMTIITQMRSFVTPLPFASISQESITFFSFHNADFPAIASQLFSMIVLALLVNFVDRWLPRGSNLLNWLFYRTLTIGVGFFTHYFLTLVFNRYCPDFIITYAPAAMFILLIVMLLTGALRFVVGLILTTVNPIIAALYTFFFATIVGKQITKSVLTTAILSGVVLLMEHWGIVSLSLLTGALVAYIPFLLVLILVWYVVSRP